jgi:hypothetical protein
MNVRFSFFTIIISVFVLGHSTLFAQNWVPLDKGIDCFYNGGIGSILIDSAADKIYISGAFHDDGNCTTMMGLAQWDGFRWDSIGANGNQGSAVKSPLCKYKDTLYSFGNLYLPPVFRSMKFNGTNWDTLSNGPNEAPMCYAEKNGDLYFGGYFDRCGSDSTFLLGKYDGQQFSGLTPYHGPQGGQVIKSIVFYQDTLYVAGNFSYNLGTTPADFAKYYNGDLQTIHSQFSGTGAGSIIETMVVYRDEIYLGGYFTQQDGYAGNYIMKWNGHAFSEVGGGTNGRVLTMKVYKNKLYVGGYFTQVGDSITSYLAAWDGTDWHPLTQDTFVFSPPMISAIDFYHDSLIIGGAFLSINGDTNLQRIAKYNHAVGQEADTNPETTDFSFYPNPVFDVLHLTLDVSIEQEIIVRIYDIRGRLIRELIHETKQAGIYSLEYNISDLHKGVYLLNMRSGDGATTKRVIKI